MISFITVPGSILLAGEYAITCEGGLGVALAPARYLRARVENDSQFRLTGYAHGVEIDGYGLADSIIAAAASFFQVSRNDPRFFGRVLADSGDFFTSEGRKLGLGSSAALAVALATYLADCIQPLDECSVGEARKRIWSIALSGHRAFQGGGSGYDVSTSLYGDMGLFVGGEIPVWLPFEQNGTIEIALIQGDRAIRSGQAVRNFQKMLASDQVLRKRFFRASNRAVKTLAEAMRLCNNQEKSTMVTGFLQNGYSLMAKEGNRLEAFHPFSVHYMNTASSCEDACLANKVTSADLFRACMATRRIGLWIGRYLGLEPELGVLKGVLAGLRQDAIPCKASGAGGELAVAFGYPSGYFSDASGVCCLSTSREGVRWQ